MMNKLFTNRRGFTLVEVMLTLLLSIMMISALVLLFTPYLQQFGSSQNFHQLRRDVSNPLQGMLQEVANAKAVYVDDTRCYSLCLIDGSTDERVYFYFSGDDLYRRVQTPDNTTISCSSGTTYAHDFDTGSSSFSQLNSLITITLAMNGMDSTSFMAKGSRYPSSVEQKTLVYDGFECNSLNAPGWSVTDGSYSSWAIDTDNDAVGKYWLRNTISSNLSGSTVDLATIEIPVDLSRVDGAYLRFQFQDEGSINEYESFTVGFYDGSSWAEIFREASERNINNLETITLNLSDLTLNSSNKIRFSGTLQKKSHRWIVDEVQIIVP